MGEQRKAETAVEGIKRSSRHLRGNLVDDLNSALPNVSAESEQLLKFHGIYAQDNRDVRRERAQRGEVLDYIFMVRVVVPGGQLSPAQWLALDHVASTLTDGTLRLTTRQAVQFHGVAKDGLRPLAESLDQALLSSFGGCGDVVRNVVSCPSLQIDQDDERLANLSRTLSRAFRPTTSAHWEIFVNGDPAVSRAGGPERPIYGDTYLPRKFKIAVAHPEDNCVDVFAQDVGLIPGTHATVGDGFNLIVGGGLGRSYANPDTFARLGNPLAFVAYDEVEEVIAAVITTYRDLGDRTERRRARMKYVVADFGPEAFRDAVEGSLGRTLRAPLALPVHFDARDHLGWHTYPDGTHHVGIPVSAGRIRDVEGGSRMRSALREVATGYDVTFHITAQQDILISRIPADARDSIIRILGEHRMRLADDLGPVGRNALACPALPTCSQALAESERRLPELVSNLEEVLARRSSVRRPLQLRMTGCPNGCARPAVAEIGVVGRTKSTYDVYVGGGLRGDRLAQLYREKVPFDDIAGVLDPLVVRWERDSLDDEPFGDFIARTGVE
ncbi:MAG TPA: NADPH-dependent assimilatory sulfite reductase hemoprotein subunit [Acidimicrobiales bacterium]|nr:NADPH-dependent assimilatory sulfite reductase hemoprotein subunit [Acidimicrobiales bacterium]